MILICKYRSLATNRASLYLSRAIFFIYKMNDGKNLSLQNDISHTKKCLTELLHYQGKWSKRKQWLAWQLSSNFSLLLSLICTHMGGKGICVNEASQKIAKYSSSLSDLKTVAHSCKHAIIHVSSACNPMKRRRFPKQNDKKQSNFQENRQIAPTAQKRGLRPTLSFCILITSVVLFLISKRCFCLIMTI